MVQREIVGDFIENDTRCVAVRFVENGENVEYIGRVPLADLIGKSKSEIRDLFLADIKRQRKANSPRVTATPDSDKFSGTVNIDD